MGTAPRLVCVIPMAAAIFATQCAREPAPDRAPTMDDLSGSWSGTMTHDGESQPLALEVEPAEAGQVSLRLSLPVIHLTRQRLGTLEPQIEGNEVTLGPFAFVYDRESGTLSGTLPAAFVPVHEIPILLRHVERVEVPARPEPSAPLVEPAWIFDAGAPLWPGAAFSNGVIYAGDDAGRLHALDARTGENRWTFEAGGPIRTRATVADGAVFLQADDGILYRLDAATGEPVWQVRVVEAAIERLPLGDPNSRYDCVGSDVTAAEGRLFLGTFDGRVLAIDPDRGTTIWEFPTQGSVLAAPAVSSGRVYAGAFGGQVHALDAATGRAIWTRDTGGAVVSTPAVDGDRLVVGSRSYDLLGLDAGTGEIAWKRYVWFSWIESSASLREDVAYIGSSDAAAAFAFDARTGARLWKTDVRGWAWGRPAVTDDRVFIGTAGMRGYQNDVHRGGVLALDRATGVPVWRHAAEPPAEGPWGFPGSPAAGAGLVFVTGLDGRISSPSLSSAVPGCLREPARPLHGV